MQHSCSLSFPTKSCPIQKKKTRASGGDSHASARQVKNGADIARYSLFQGENNEAEVTDHAT